VFTAPYRVNRVIPSAPRTSRAWVISARAAVVSRREGRAAKKPQLRGSLSRSEGAKAFGLPGEAVGFRAREDAGAGRGEGEDGFAEDAEALHYS
jgi:hypothetical protein